MHVGIGWRSTGDDVQEVKHAALEMREGSGDGSGGAAMPTADVDQRVESIPRNTLPHSLSMIGIRKRLSETMPLFSKAFMSLALKDRNGRPEGG